jgi:alpha-beta hydrolase superfamily lysophospholipase
MIEAVEFPSEGALLRGRFYRPERLPPFPAVIMTHGTTATITMALDHYAEVFCHSGLAVLLYDHRNFGMSGGELRQQINPPGVPVVHRLWWPARITLGKLRHPRRSADAGAI